MVFSITFRRIVAHLYRVLCLGSARLTVRIIVDHIIQVLQDEFLRDAFGSDYTKLLVKDILPVQKYCSEMPVELWNGQVPSRNTNSVSFDHVIYYASLDQFIW